jgi:hypothetical protein
VAYEETVIDGALHWRDPEMNTEWNPFSTEALTSMFLGALSANEDLADRVESLESEDFAAPSQPGVPPPWPYNPAPSGPVNPAPMGDPHGDRTGTWPFPSGVSTCEAGHRGSLTPLTPWGLGAR